LIDISFSFPGSCRPKSIAPRGRTKCGPVARARRGIAPGTSSRGEKQRAPGDRLPGRIADPSPTAANDGETGNHQARLETFMLLGFTHRCGENSKGYFQVWRETAGKRMRAKTPADQGGVGHSAARAGRRHRPAPPSAPWRESPWRPTRGWRRSMLQINRGGVLKGPAIGSHVREPKLMSQEPYAGIGYARRSMTRNLLERKGGCRQTADLFHTRPAALMDFPLGSRKLTSYPGDLGQFASVYTVGQSTSSRILIVTEIARTSLKVGATAALMSLARWRDRRERVKHVATSSAGPATLSTRCSFPHFNGGRGASICPAPDKRRSGFAQRHDHNQRPATPATSPQIRRRD
jgi:hypothetical protein